MVRELVTQLFKFSGVLVFGPKRDEVTGNGENYIMSLGIFTPYPILCGW